MNFGSAFISIDETVDAKEVLDRNDFVGLYFAEWNKPCRRFTRKLGEASTNSSSLLGMSVPIIYVSSDPNEEHFVNAYAEMKWLAIPFSEHEIRRDIALHLDIRQVPCFVLFDTKKGVIVSKDGKLFEEQMSKFYNPLLSAVALSFTT